MIKVLFVCLGNICRSPMAEAIFRKKVTDAGLDQVIFIDSAGTGDWHLGKPPHRGTQEILHQNQIDYAGMKARKVTSADLEAFDYILAMDAKNLADLQAMAGQKKTGEIARLLAFHPNATIVDVPDPYFTGNFEEVYELLDHSCEALLRYIRKEKGI